MPVIEVARMVDGWRHKLPYPELFEIYEKNQVKASINEIIYNAVFMTSTNRYYIENSDVELIGNIPEFYDTYDIKIDWDKIKDIFIRFINLSNIECSI